MIRCQLNGSNRGQPAYALALRSLSWQGHGTDLLGDSLSHSEYGIPKVRILVHIPRILDLFRTPSRLLAYLFSTFAIGCTPWLFINGL